MSPPENNNPPNPKPTGKDETPTSGGRKTTSSSSSRPQEPALKCPRCDSSNTKFCYYNNYSLTQPRHFCKTCRRYWTRGGALRSVPIGGGCQKNKKMKSCAASRVCSEDPKNASLTPNGLKFFQGLSPAMDFQLGGATTNTALFSNQFSSFGDIVTTTSATGISCFSLDPSPSTSSVMGFGFPLGGSLNVLKNFESLSSMNQEMHWKLQQQRLAMLFVGENQTENTSVVLPCANAIEPTNEKTQHFLFEDLDNSSKIESFGTGTSSRKDALSTEWFFDNSYAPIAQTPATSESHVNENSSSWSGIQAWSDLTRYTALP